MGDNQNLSVSSASADAGLDSVALEKTPTMVAPKVIVDDVIKRLSPVDLSALPDVPTDGTQDIGDAVMRARKASHNWRLVPQADRIAALRRAAKSMLAARAEILTLVRLEVGKVDVDALFTEALGPLDALNGWARVVKKASRQKVGLNRLSFPKKRARIDLCPRGVIGIIAPWNFPVAGLYRSVFPALMTGNAVVLKPSEYTPKSSQWFIDKLAAELPDSLVQVVQGGARAGSDLLDSGIDACIFTGSCASGEKVRQKCAELAIPSSIEMGGKDAAIVVSDCDLDRTLAGVTHWALQNAGQACGAIEVCYVDRGIADEFVSRLGQAWSRLRSGPGDFAQVDVAPLANSRQLQIVEQQIAQAVELGAKVITGGEALGTGLWHQPTLLDHCDERMDVVREETFGPVLAIVRVDGAAEGISKVNASPYGLTASIWSKDIARAERLAERLNVGVVSINNHAMTGAIVDLPWSGLRKTGHGIANSALSLTTFCHPKALLVDENSGPEPFWLPFDEKAWELGDILCDAQIGKIGRAWKLPILISKRLTVIKRFFG